MTPAIALLIIGAILLKAGWSGSNIVDVALGKETKKPWGTADGAESAGNPTTEAPDAPGVTGSIGGTHGTTLVDGKPVANWIVPWVNLARKNGWNGVVVSGWRSTALQSSLYNNAQAGRSALPAAAPGTSNHEYTTFPRGAIDVSDPDGFQRALNKVMGPVPLRRDPTIGDPPHFSFTGR